MKFTERFLKDDFVGVHFAVNVFIATAILWLLLRLAANLNPIRIISSMSAASDPKVKQAWSAFKGRIINAAVGCAVGLLFLVLAGKHEIALAVALAVTMLLSTYFVRVQVMWRLAPITAGWRTHHSKLTAVEIAVRHVDEVMLCCVVGVGVSWLVSKLWPVAEPDNRGEPHHWSRPAVSRSTCRRGPNPT